MHNTAQILLYNQLDKRYILDWIKNIFYIHNTWNIFVNWKKLKLNKYSKVIDYAWWSYLIDKLSFEWYNSMFLEFNNFFDWILYYSKKFNINKIYLISPSENYLKIKFINISSNLKKYWIELVFIDDKYSFLLSHSDFLSNYWKPWLLEHFYRYMRKRFNILMIWNKPIWDLWNYDKFNRKFSRTHNKTNKLKLKKNKFFIEACSKYWFEPNYVFPTNREDALILLDYFIENDLDNFWPFQDAMYSDDPFVFHSLISSSINFWFLSPLEVIKAIEKSSTNIENKEWFIRQILWWREYMYHFFNYYKDTIYNWNFFNHSNKLPNLFWDYKINENNVVENSFFSNDNKNIPSRMNCLNRVLTNVHRYNHSHHIERLMIIWNYWLLSKINPLELAFWFWEYYIDAFEWVVIPNVLWMSQYSDWWKLATKPYVSSANYISKMSDYCNNCFFDKNKKYWDDACPFNYLYWNFVNENKSYLKKIRQSFIIKNLEKIDINQIKDMSFKYFNNYN